jgi:hypothetical protein
MVSKYTFIKPELTFLHLRKVATVLDEHYFHIQLLPVLRLLELFSKEVLADTIGEKTFVLQRCRLLSNLGQASLSEQVMQK